MKFTQTLPPEYELYEGIRVDELERTRLVQMFIGAVIVYLSYNLIQLLVILLRPEYQSADLQFQNLSIKLIISILTLAIPTLIVITIHEFIHAIFLWFYTGHWPTVHAAWDGICLRFPTWYIPRNQFLVTNLAPLCIISLIGFSLIPFIPQNHLGLLVFLTVMNIGASYADITSSAYLILHASSIYIELEGRIHIDKSLRSNTVPDRKVKIRSKIEEWIKKIDPITDSG